MSSPQAQREKSDKFGKVEFFLSLLVVIVFYLYLKKGDGSPILANCHGRRLFTTFK